MFIQEVGGSIPLSSTKKIKGSRFSNIVDRSWRCFDASFNNIIGCELAHGDSYRQGRRITFKMLSPFVTKFTRLMVPTMDIRRPET